MSTPSHPPALHELLQQYNHERNTQFAPAEFEQLLTFVPLLIVAVSDMSVDGVEMGYLTGVMAEQTVANATDQGLSIEARLELLNAYLAEVKYLMAHLSTWEDQMLQALKHVLADRPDHRTRVQLRMLAMAMASRGINVYEEAKIRDVSALLGLSLVGL